MARPSPHRTFLATLALAAVAANVACLPPAAQRRLDRGEAKRTRRGIAVLPTLRDARGLVLGNSRVLHAIDEEVLTRTLEERLGPGHRARSLSFGGATPASYAYYLDRILEEGLATDLSWVVVGVTPIDLNVDFHGHQNALRYLYGPRQIGFLLGAGEWPLACELLSYQTFPLYRYRQQVKEAARRAPDALDGQVEPRTDAERAAASAWTLAHYERRFLQRYEVHPLERAALRRVLDRCEQANLDVAILVMPETPDLRALQAERVGTAFDDTLEDLAAGRPGVTVLRWDDPAIADRFSYYDSAHIAPEARESFSTMLGETLAGIRR